MFVEGELDTTAGIVLWLVEPVSGHHLYMDNLFIFLTSSLFKTLENLVLKFAVLCD